MPAIRIDRKNKQFFLKTKNTVYVLGLFADKYPVHLYYGRKGNKNAELTCGNTRYSFDAYTLEDSVNNVKYYSDVAAQEFSLFDSGDYRAPAMKLRNLTTGACTTNYVYKSARRFKGRAPIDGLAFAEADEKTETLELNIEDKASGCLIRLYYTVFPECDIISRYFTIENKGKNDMKIEKCMSFCLDIPNVDLDMITLQGGYYEERVYQRAHLIHGNQSVYSRRGSSSHHFNPFFMLADPKATEEKGEAYGFNLVYSGSFLGEVEVSCNNSTRVLSGLGSDNFSYLLKSGESFTSPEAVMTYTTKGIGQVSRNMHSFVRSHILPKEKFESRPVVLNSWEAMYFDIDQKVLVDFAREAAKCGMDMLVMDDGWFGARINDKAGLGDWYENKDKFPDGLGAFVDKVKAEGVKFGIWIEPEMINPDSDLYRAHPDWAMAVPKYEAKLSRYQLVLDMANPDVIEYLKESFSKTFDGVAIDYFKWDMNRNLCGVYSSALPAERQGEAEYRYMRGVYELFTWFGEHFKDAMIENCSGGGGRYDLGMMKHSTQIWTSDNTHPDKRMYIQYGSSFGYPASVMSCHVAKLEECENPRFLDYRFRLAMNGPLGYELNILEASDAAKANMKAQVEEYRKYEKLILGGDFYRLLNPYETDGKYAYYFVNEDNSEILLTFLQNFGDKKPKEYRLKVSRAIPNVTYTDKISGKSYEGAELNRGITVTTDAEDQYGVMFHFTRRKF